MSCLQRQFTHGPFKRYSANLLIRQSLDESHGVVLWNAKAKSRDSLKRKLERVIGTLCFSLCCHCIYSLSVSLLFYTIIVFHYCIQHRRIEIHNKITYRNISVLYWLSPPISCRVPYMETLTGNTHSHKGLMGWTVDSALFKQWEQAPNMEI